MTINRIINGKQIEIKLTETEMWDAYQEQEHEFDKDDVRHMLEEYEWYWTDENGESNPPTLTEKQIDDAACWAREWLDENDLIAEVRWNFIHDAVEEALK